MRRVYVDTEYCYPGMRKGQPRPTSADKRQIVQIAAIVFDDEVGSEIAKFEALVTPYDETTLPEFFVELTGISQKDVDKSAIGFSDALERFHAFCAGLPVWTFDKDEEVFRQNCGYYSIAFPFDNHFVRVKGMLPRWGIDPDRYSSGTLYQAVNLPLDGHVHNALHDVRSMAQAVHAFENQGK